MVDHSSAGKARYVLFSKGHRQSSLLFAVEVFSEDSALQVTEKLTYNKSKIICTLLSELCSLVYSNSNESMLCWLIPPLWPFLPELDSVSLQPKENIINSCSHQKTWHLTVNTFFLRSFTETPQQAGFLGDQSQYYEVDASLSSAHSSSTYTDTVNSWSHTNTMQQPSFLHLKGSR